MKGTRIIQTSKRRLSIVTVIVTASVLMLLIASLLSFSHIGKQNGFSANDGPVADSDPLARTSYNTITMDGTVNVGAEWNAADEVFDSGSPYVLYGTWDASNIYFGIGGGGGWTFLDFWVIYLDTDAGASGTPVDTNPITASGAITFPAGFLANYRFHGIAPIGAPVLQLWTGAPDWSGALGSPNVLFSPSEAEASIPHVDVGSPSSIDFLGFIDMTGDGTIEVVHPFTNPVPDMTGGTWFVFNGYAAPGQAPNGVPELSDLALPVALIGVMGIVFYVRRRKD